MMDTTGESSTKGLRPSIRGYPCIVTDCYEPVRHDSYQVQCISGPQYPSYPKCLLDEGAIIVPLQLPHSQEVETTVIDAGVSFDLPELDKSREAANTNINDQQQLEESHLSSSQTRPASHVPNEIWLAILKNNEDELVHLWLDVRSACVQLRSCIEHMHRDGCLRRACISFDRVQAGKTHRFTLQHYGDLSADGRWASFRMSQLPNCTDAQDTYWSSSRLAAAVSDQISVRLAPYVHTFVLPAVRSGERWMEVEVEWRPMITRLFQCVRNFSGDAGGQCHGGLPLQYPAP